MVDYNIIVDDTKMMKQMMVEEGVPRKRYKIF